MPTTVQIAGQDTALEFPDSMSQDEIQGVLRRKFGKTSGTGTAQPAAAPDPSVTEDNYQGDEERGSLPPGSTPITPEPASKAPEPVEIPEETRRSLEELRSLKPGEVRGEFPDSLFEQPEPIQERVGRQIEESKAYRFITKPLAQFAGKIGEGVRTGLTLPFQLAQERAENSPDGEGGTAERIMAATPSDKAIDITSGVAQGVAEMGEFFTSPMGIATLGIGGLPEAAQKVIAQAFASQMAQSLPATGAEIAAEMRKPESERDYTKIARLSTGGAAATLFAGIGAKHGLSVEAPKVAAPPKNPLAAQAEAIKPVAPLTAAALEQQAGSSLAPSSPSGAPSNAVPEPLEPSPNDVNTAPNLSGDISSAESGGKGFESLSADAQSRVVSGVLSSLDDSQVLDSIIKLVPVDVVDNFVGEKVSPNDPAHYKAVLKDRLSSLGVSDLTVGHDVSRFFNSVLSLPEFSSTRNGAELSEGSDLGGLPEKEPTTAVAPESFHGKEGQELTAASKEQPALKGEENAQAIRGNKEKLPQVREANRVSEAVVGHDLESPPSEQSEPVEPGAQGEGQAREPVREAAPEPVAEEQPLSKEVVAASAETPPAAQPTEEPPAAAVEPTSAAAPAEASKPKTASPERNRIVEHPSVPIDFIESSQEFRDNAIVEKYREKIRNGEPLDPVRVVIDQKTGKFSITDGHHRYEAAKLEGLTHIPVAEKIVPYEKLYINREGFRGVGESGHAGSLERGEGPKVGFTPGSSAEAKIGERPYSLAAGQVRGDYSPDVGPHRLDLFPSAEAYGRWAQRGRPLRASGEPDLGADTPTGQGVSEINPELKTPPTGPQTIASYGGKDVPVDYVPREKTEGAKTYANRVFKVAAQRVSDNLQAGEKGYVTTPDGKRYEISRESKRAKLVEAPDKSHDKVSGEPKAETPAAAVAKVEERVSDVAKTEGQRPAKDVKSELLQRIEDEIQKVIDENKVTLEKRDDGRWVAQGSDSAIADVSKEGGKIKVSVDNPGRKNRFTKNVANEAEAEFLVKAMAATGPGKVTIHIPGDGEFTIYRVGSAMVDLWGRAARLDTTSTSKPAKLPSGRGGIKEDADAAIKMYGGPDDAYRTVRRQAETVEDADVKSKAGELADEIYKQTSAGWSAKLAESAQSVLDDRQSDVDSAQAALDKANKAKKPNKVKIDELTKELTKATEIRDRYQKELEKHKADESSARKALGITEDVEPPASKDAETETEPTPPEPKPEPAATVAKNASVEEPAPGENVPPAIDFEHPKAGTPEAEAISAKSQTASDAEQAVYDKLQKAEAEEKSAGYGTKRREQAEARAQKLREQKWELQKQNTPLHDQSQEMFWEHLAQNGHWTQKWGATVELLKHRAERLQKQSEALREEGKRKEADEAYYKAKALGEKARSVSDEAYKLLQKEGEKQLTEMGASHDEARHEAMQAANMQMSYPGTKAMQELHHRMRVIESDRSKAKLEQEVDALKKEFGILHDTGFERRVREASSPERARELIEAQRKDYLARRKEEAAKEKAKQDAREQQQVDEIEKAKSIDPEKLRWTIAGPKGERVWQAVEGKPVSLENAPELKFFVHRKNGVGWTVIEEQTGLRIGDGGKSQAEAVQFANEKFSKTNAEQRAEMITKGLDGSPPKPGIGAPAEPAPKIHGMGGAIPEEFEAPGGSAVGIKNSSVDAQRQRRGLEPTMAPMRLTNPVLWDRVMSKIDQDPGWQDRLIYGTKDAPGLINKPRSVSPEETMALQQRYADLQNEYDRSTRELSQAYDDGQEERVAELQKQTAAWSDKLSEFEQMTREIGTEWGRAGQVRQRMLNRDFSLAAMESQWRSTRGGRPLTDVERIQLIDTQKRLEESQRKASEAEERAQQETRERMVAQALNETLRQQRPAFDKRVLDKASQIVEGWKSAHDEGVKNIRERLMRMSAGVDPTLILDLAKIGRYKIAKFALEKAGFVDAMVRDLGEKVRPYLDEAWEASNSLINKSLEKTPDGVKRAVKKMDAKERSADAREKIKSLAERGELDGIKPQIDKLLRAMVELDPSIAEGLKKDPSNTRNRVVDEVHGILKEIIPDLSRRQAQDAVSGYGDFTPLRKDDVSLTVRDLKGQLQQVSKLEDIQSKKPLQKTGLERRDQSDEERRLTKQVNEAKRRYGVVVTDPATQLKSALNARKTALRNQIADLSYEIAKRERIVKEKSPSPSDDELDQLRQKRDELKAEHEQIFPKGKITDEQRAAAAERSIDREITEVQRQIKEGDIFPEGQKPKVSTPAIEAKRARLEALKAEREGLRELIQPSHVPEVEELEKINARRESLQKSLDELTRKINEGDVSTNPAARKTELTTELENMRAERDELNKIVAELRSAAKPKRTVEEKYNSALKARLTREIADKTERMARGDFEPKPKPPTPPLNPETAKLNDEAAKVRSEWEKRLLQERLKQRTTKEKMADAAVKWSRVAKLLSWKVYPKLLNAALLRSVFEPVSRLAGQPLRLIAPDVYRKAYAETGLSVRAEATYVKTALTSWDKAWEKLKTGETNIDRLRESSGVKPDMEMLNFVGNSHGMFKEPIRQASFERAKQQLLEQYIREGQDVTDPLVQTQLLSEAAEHGDRNIFMRPNMVTRYLIKVPIGALKSGPFFGAKSLARTMEFLMPIVNVPANIAAHTMRLNPAVGFGEAALRLYHAAKNGELENGAKELSRSDAEAIGRAFKLGMLGTVLAAYAWNNPEDFGGVYEEGRRKSGAMKSGEIKLFGKVMPSWLNHAPEILWLNTVASARRVRDKYVANHPHEKGAADLDAAWFTLLAPVKNFPVVDTYLRTFSETRSLGRAAGAMVRDAAIPGVVTSTMNALGEKKKPRTFVDEVKMGVPGLRQTVPAAGRK